MVSSTVTVISAWVPSAERVLSSAYIDTSKFEAMRGLFLLVLSGSAIAAANAISLSESVSSNASGCCSDGVSLVTLVEEGILDLLLDHMLKNYLLNIANMP